MKTRIAFLGMALLLGGCSSPETPATKDWSDFTSRARPVIIRDPSAPDEDIQGLQREQEERARAEEARLATQPKVTAAFVDLPIRDAILEISNQTKTAIVLDQTVTGNITLDLKQVPQETALRMVIFPGGYAYTREGPTYFVGTPDPTNRTFMTLTTSRIVSTYLPPKLIVASLNKAFASYLSHSEGTNKLVLTGPSSILDRLETEIRLLDRPPAQIQIEALVVETKIGNDFNLGLDYSKIETTLQKELHADTSTKTDRKLDVIGKLSLGFEFLASQNRARINSNPKVVTTSGTAAEIKSLFETYVVINRPGASFVSTELQIIKSGTMLKVTPVITRNDEVELTVEPEVATVVGVSTDPNDASNNLPIISRRSVKSTVRLKSGDVLVIGGLYEEQMMKLASGIPFLKDMPVLSVLAGKEEHSTNTSELLIFISPKVLK
jgi:type IV pilus assembly protein PilQ